METKLSNIDEICNFAVGLLQPVPALQAEYDQLRKMLEDVQKVNKEGDEKDREHLTLSTTSYQFCIRFLCERETGKNSCSVVIC